MKLETVNETRRLDYRGWLLSVENRLRNWYDTAPHGIRLDYFISGRLPEVSIATRVEILPEDFRNGPPTGRDAIDYAAFFCPQLPHWRRVARARGYDIAGKDIEGISCRVEKIPAPAPGALTKKECREQIQEDLTAYLDGIQSFLPEGCY